MNKERIDALSQFRNEVVAGNFPYSQTNISMGKEEKDKFLEALDKWKPTHQ